MRRVAVVLATMIATMIAGVALTGCAGTPRTAVDVRTVVLDIKWSTFSANTIDARPGEVIRFVVRNHDPIPHELIVGDSAVQDYHEHGTEAHHAARPGEISVAPESTATTTYTVIGRTPLLFGCHLPGHWAYGMHGTIAVA